MKIKVSIADDHPIVIQGIEKMLDNHPLIELIHTSKNGESLLRNLKTALPDVLLLDIQMPGQQGDELAAYVTQHYPEIRIMVLTNMDHPFHVRNMFKHGVKGYLLKSADKYELAEAIDSIYKGSNYIDRLLRDQLLYEVLDNKKAHNIPTITKREKEILDMIASEMTSPQIAKKLFISLSTVENHRSNLFLKLGVKNVVGLISKAAQLGLIK